MNFRVEAQVAEQLLPAPFALILHNGYAIAGICLIRLEEVRPSGFPTFIEFSSENAAHRIAVEWVDSDGKTRQGVYIPRRDSNFWLSRMAGGKLFPGEQSPAKFEVQDDGQAVSLSANSQDGVMSLSVRGRESDVFPPDSCFSSLEESSDFFAGGSVGYSATKRCDRFDGIELKTDQWSVRPFQVEEVHSSFFSDETIFPAGSVELDHALVMRNVAHRWVAQENLTV